ncbi:hypothetical protein [Candidatus Cryosericum septentrionale]|uniref:Uncharacterized protein n=1 Tax=Candidatus Cryosericum septentrionale TaxID=2290913 RepID=A0A398DSD5_9BACT|nr:hypothetical protein [Candidatus Cryosericum septentrionale]RIE16949.1 hypothetical protein SMC1_03855 [Candidatus Cryosericum septentrionale]
MKRLSVPARIIIIVYLVIAFFMLIVPPTAPGPLKPTKGYVPETNYGALFANMLTLSIVATLALIALSLLSSKREGKEKEDQHGTGTDNV